MGWPQSQDYNEAIQNAKTCFKDPELSKGAAVTNPLGMPLPCSGNFADVYQVHCPETKTRWAIKCFTRGDPKALEDRYAKIDQHLQQAKLPFAVGFRYLVEGIRVRKEWHPVLKMQWVEGFTLNHFVRDNLDKPNVLDALLQIWVRMGKRLREANMAHADLQHGNVMLVAGSTSASLAVKLIDYDGMWVPALEGKKSGEVGHPAYQHTKRLYEGTYSKEVDRFPLLVVATALRCLRVAGRPLWEKFDNGDNLLFREADLAAPERSPLFAELAKIQDAQAQKLVDTLLKATTEPLEDTPPVDLLLGESAKKPVAVTNPGPAAPMAEAAFADLGDPESAGTSAVRPRQRGSSASGKKWALIGGGAAVLLATVLILVLSGGGKKEPDTPNNNNQVQPDNRKDDKQAQTTQTVPPAVALAFADLPSLRIAPGSSQRFSLKVNGVNGDASFRMEFQDLPEGVRHEQVALDKRTGGSEWLLAVDGSVAPLDKELTVVAFVGQRSIQGKIRLSVPTRTVVKPPEPPQEGQATQLGQFKTQDPILGIACSPDGQRGLAITREHLYLFDPATGKVAGPRFAAPEPPLTAAAWMPDSRRVLLAGKGMLLIVDPQTRQATDAINRTVANLTALALSGDGRRLAAVQPNGDVQLFDLENRKLLHTLPELSPTNHLLAFSQDGKRLLLSAQKPKRKRVLIDVDSGKELLALDATNTIPDLLSLAVTPDGKQCVLGFAPGILRMWDLENNKPSRRAFAVHQSPINTCAYAADGRFILSGNDEGRARLWETASGVQVRQLTGHTGAVVAVALSPDGQRAFTAGADNTVRSWSLGISAAVAATPMPMPTPPPVPAPAQGDRRLDAVNSFMDSIAFSPDGGKVYGSAHEAVTVWDVATGKTTEEFRQRNDSWTRGQLILGGGILMVMRDRSVSFRPPNAPAARAVGTLPSDALALAVSSDGKRGASICGNEAKDEAGQFVRKDGVVVWEKSALQLWDVDNGKELHSLPLPRGPWRSVALSADGRRAVASGPDATGRPIVMAVEVATGKVLRSRSFQAGGGFVTSLALSPDGKRAAILLTSKVIVWDIDTDKEVGVDTPRGERHYCACFSPDGRRIVCCGGDDQRPTATALLLEASTGRELAHKEVQDRTIRGVAFAADGRWVAAFSASRHLYLWDFAAAGKPAPPAGVERPRLPAPADADQEKALATLKQLFADEYARAKPTDRVARLALADTLMAKAREIKDNPTDRFVLFREAADIYQQLAAAASLLAALDALAGEYDVDRVALKEKALNDMAEVTKASAGYKLLADSCLAVLDDAREAENFAAMSRLVGLAESVASKSQDGPTQTKVKAAVKEARDLVKESEAAVQAETTLKAQPDDAAANLVRGKFLCFRIGAWQRGLPLLAKGEDEKLRDLASKDAANPSGADEQVKLADAWFDVTKSMSGGKGEVLRRAALWYGLALDSGLTALNKERVEKQLKAIEPQLPPTRALQAGGELRSMVNARGPDVRLAYLPDGSRLVASSQKGELKLWDARTGKEEMTLRGGNPGIRSMVVSPDGVWIVTTGLGSLRWNNVPDPEKTTSQGIGVKTQSVAYVGKTKRLIIGTDEGRLLAMEDAVGSYYGLDQKGFGSGFSVVAACTGGGGLALAGADNGTLLLYSLQAGARQPPLRLGLHAGAVLGVALLPDGSRAVSTGEDKTLRVWDVKQRSEVRRLVGHSGIVTSLSLSPDGRRLATSGEDGTVRVWDLTTFQELRRFVGHKGKVNAVTFAPDGRRLASAGEDGTIRIWGF